jgi:hypothetical protein
MIFRVFKFNLVVQKVSKLEVERASDRLRKDELSGFEIYWLD